MIGSTSEGWKILITYMELFVRAISSKFQESRFLTKLYVLRNKVRRETCENELLIDMIENLMDKVEFKIQEKPCQIIYFTDKIIQNLDLEDKRLNLYLFNKLKYMDGLLRSKGYRTMQKWKVAERIFAYRLNIYLRLVEISHE